MTYSNWQLRKTVTADTEMTISERFHALVIIDSIDWKSGLRKFNNRKHFNNWLNMLAGHNALNPVDLNNTIKVMHKFGYCTIDGTTLQLSSESEALDIG